MKCQDNGFHLIVAWIKNSLILKVKNHFKSCLYRIEKIVCVFSGEFYGFSYHPKPSLMSQFEIHCHNSVAQHKMILTTFLIQHIVVRGIIDKYSSLYFFTF